MTHDICLFYIYIYVFFSLHICGSMAVSNRLHSLGITKLPGPLLATEAADSGGQVTYDKLHIPVTGDRLQVTGDR